jgi:hypothetical protein
MVTIDVPSLHDYEITGYGVDGPARRIQFALVAPKGVANRGMSELTFSGVEGYFLEHDLGTSVVFAVERVHLQRFVEENAQRFIVSAKWGWPLFWRGSIQDSVAWLASRQCHPWEISSSYGLAGWVVASGVTYRERHA